MDGKKGFTKMTSVAQYTGSADHVPLANVNKYVGSSWLHKRMSQHNF